MFTLFLFATSLIYFPSTFSKLYVWIQKILKELYIPLCNYENVRCMPALERDGIIIRPVLCKVRAGHAVPCMSLSVAQQFAFIITINPAMFLGILEAILPSLWNRGRHCAFPLKYDTSPLAAPKCWCASLHKPSPGVNVWSPVLSSRLLPFTCPQRPGPPHLLLRVTEKRTNQLISELILIAQCYVSSTANPLVSK